MYRGLILIHRKSRESFSPTLLGEKQACVWVTCLRQIVFGFEGYGLESLAEVGDEIYRDAQAYQFCLEVICGLHSPLIGETEVIGQFRNFFKRSEWVQVMNHSGKLLKLIQNWQADAKKVREKHLLSIGSQSYGSLVRRYLRDFSDSKGPRHVTIVGAGQLTRELLPWILKEDIRVRVVGRLHSPRLRQLQMAFGQIEIVTQIESPPLLPASLIVAAPAPAAQIRSVLQAFPAYDQILDLRGEASNDPIVFSGMKSNFELIELKTLFAEVEKTRVKALALARNARQAITQLVAAHACRAENRPFGWDDLCA